MQLSQLEYSKSCSEQIIFASCKFTGNIQEFLPVYYPNLKKLFFINCCIIDTCQFQLFKNLEELEIENVFIAKQVVNEAGEENCEKLSTQITIKSLSNIVYGEILNQLPIPPSNLKVLCAFVNFAQEFKNQIYQTDIRFMINISSIGSIPKCTLIDNESVLCFEWIYQFLFAVSQNEYTKSYPPIELKISKFKDATNLTIIELKEIAETNKLQITRTLIIGESQQILLVKLSNIKAREIVIYINQSKRTQINGFDDKSINKCPGQL
ncbi:hypothetical protein FGO68_gene11392 [Halteria grandinella]|uniref:Uncharacterized protein n=1 Tax=Halteria grandinella TaxID=5974 RepID=A0A8J8P4T5_HALGN|nr:hypothetical protein FGO68_gene11392 [Halteria grandinella]